MEYDCYQHYFVDDFDREEDFYQSTAPSEDIWKKFELLPTPPMSPTRTLSDSKLSWRSKVLGQDEESEGQFIPDAAGKLFGNLSSIIIRDCMWSCFSASKQLEKVKAQAVSPPAAVAAAAAQISVRPSKAQCVSPGAPLAGPPADCVDPAAVLTFPAGGCRKPASSGSESRSDSSDDEEEIDVVTVESKQNRVRLVNARKPVTVRADSCPRRFHMSVHRQQHNYAARSPDSDPDEDDDDEEEEEDDDEEDDEEEEEEEDEEYAEEPPSKRNRASPGQQPDACRLGSASESPLDSDADDTDRRRNHNFLERKRRNDLRSRFLALRDQVPGLVSAKTPKVAILTHATEYLSDLHAREKRQLQEKKRLRTRQQQLMRRLSELKRS